jgi:dTMP kinase
MGPVELLRGFFISLEGLDGSGKTSIGERLANTLQALGRETLLTREPGGTAIGEQIRAVLLGSDSHVMRAETEALLFAASRAQHVAEVIQPALARGAVVISDRYTDSSLAYQWGGRGLALDAVVGAQALATGGMQPDLTLLLDLPVPIAMQRKKEDAGEANRLDREAVQFHTRVRDAYHSLAAADPARWRVIDADRPRDEVWSDVWATVEPLVLPSAGQPPGGRASRRQAPT